MEEYIPYLLPAVITVIFNVIFYLLIKRRIDNSIERFRNSYSGVFKEKIDIYKSLLIELHDLTLKINQYQYLDNEEFNTEIKSGFNKLIKIYLTNRPFISLEIISLFQKITKEIQSIYEALTLGSIARIGKMQVDQMQKFDTAYWEAVNKLRDNKSLKEIEEGIVLEMRKELQAI